MAGLHRRTRQAVYDALLREGPLTPARLSALGFDRRTARHVVEELGGAGWLEVSRSRTWTAGPAVGHVLVLKATWRSITAALFDAHGRLMVRSARAISLEPRHGAADNASAVRSQVSAVTREVTGQTAQPPRGVLVVWPASIPVDGARPIRSGLRHRAWRDVDLHELFSVAINATCGTSDEATLPVSFLNDADAEALGEAHYGRARGARNLLLIKICEGIGAALVIDGGIYRGAHGRAGEIGHVVPSISPTSTRQRREACTCGALDHLESYASSRAVIRELFPDTDRLSYEQCMADILARRDEHRVRSVLQESGEIIGRTLLPMVQLVDPDRIIVSSEPDDPIILDSIIISLKSGAQIDGEQVTRGSFGSDEELTMGLRGGALCAIEDYLVPRLRRGILGDTTPEDNGASELLV